MSPARASRVAGGVLAGTAAVVLLSGTAVAGATHPAHVSSTSTPASEQEAAAPTAPAGTRAAALGTTRYVALTTQSGRQYLRLVNRRTGAVIRTLASAPTPASFGDRAFTSVDLLRDGTVFFVRQGAGKAFAANGPVYGKVLYRANPAGRVVVFMKSVPVAKVSADGRSLALTQVTHPAKARYQLQRVRFGSVSGGKFTTRRETRIPTDSNGVATVELATPWVNTWVGNGAILLSQGCCGESSYQIMQKTGRSRNVLSGGESEVLGLTRRNEALIFTEWAQAKPYKQIGYRVFKVGATTRATVVWSTKTDFAHAKEAAIKATRPVPFEYPAKTYPYRGKDKVLASYI